jgi:integrase
VNGVDTLTVVTIKEAIDEYLKLVLSENTLKVKKIWLKRFVNSLPEKENTLLNEVTITNVNNCLRNWFDQYENSNTFNLARQVLIGFIKWENEEENMKLSIKKSNVLGRRKNSSVRRIPYSSKDIECLINEVKDPKNRKYLLLLVLLLVMAPRASEIAGLTWNDVFSKEGYISLRRKGGKIQDLPMCNELQQLFKLFFDELDRPSLNTYVFASDSKPIPDRFDIYKLIKNLAKNTSVKYRGVHIFRNNLANLFDKHKIKNSAFLENFGWEDERMKNVYVNNENDSELIKIQGEVILSNRILEE